MNWKKETNEIKIRKRLAKQQGGHQAVDLQHAKGRLTIRERLERLLDKNSFEEQGEITGSSDSNGKAVIDSFTPANFVLGFGKINGRQVIVGGEDFTVKGGSPNPAGLRKSIYTEELALKYKIPLIRLHEGGGGSVAGPSKKGRNSSGDPVFSKSRFKSIADTLKTIPVVSAALGPVAGLPAARFVASHFRVMTKKTSQILSLPMQGGVESINVSAAASVFMYEFGTQRPASDCSENCVAAAVYGFFGDENLLPSLFSLAKFAEKS